MHSFWTAEYYLVLAIASLPVLANIKRPGVGWGLFFLSILVFVGLRHEVGSDWHGYLMIYENTSKLSIQGVLYSSEPLYYVIVWLSNRLNGGIYLANLTTSFVFLVGVFAFCKKQSDPWLSLTIAIPFLIIVVGMSANRQAAAIGISLYLLANWDRWPILYKILLIIAAAAIHNSAIAISLLFLTDKKISFLAKIGISAATIYFLSSNILEITAVDRYLTSYVEKKSINHASGGLHQTLLNAAPALTLLALHFFWNQPFPRNGYLKPITYAAAISLPLVLIFSVAVSRLSFFLFPASIAGIPIITNYVFRNLTPLHAKLPVLVFNFIVLAAWLNFANHASNHIPYKNYLFL